MRVDRIDPDRFDIIDRRREPDRLDNRGGASLEARGDGGVGRLRKGHAVDHRPAALPRRQRVELVAPPQADAGRRSEEHTSELQSIMRLPYAVFRFKKKKYLDTRH